MDISQLLNSDLGKQIIGGIGNQTGTSEKEVTSVVSAAAPVLLGMLHKNASSEEGASGIMGALNKHDGSILDNLSGFFGSGDSTSDGNGILKHVLGDNRNSVENAISKKTGVDSSKVSSILAMLAPFLWVSRKQQKMPVVYKVARIRCLIGWLLGGSGGSSLGAIFFLRFGGGRKNPVHGGLLGKRLVVGLPFGVEVSSGDGKCYAVLSLFLKANLCESFSFMLILRYISKVAGISETWYNISFRISSWL